MSLEIYLLATVLIFITSFIFAMLGLGGGMLYVPILKWLELPLKTTAIPLGLLLNGLNTLSAFIAYARQGLVDFWGGLPAAIAAVLFAPIGAWCVQFVPYQWLIGLFSVAILIAALRSLFSTEPDENRLFATKRKILFIGSLAGGFAGFMGGLLGIGGGFIIAPLLMELGYPAKQAAATTAFIVTFSSFAGFLGHLGMGHLDPTLVILAVLAVLIGSQLGAWFMMNKAKSVWIKKLYGIVLLLVAIQLIFSLLNEKGN